MSNVAVEKIHNDAASPTLFEQISEIAEKVRRRAFEIFEGRGGAEGRSLDDWLQAERDMILSPETELIEKDGKFQVRFAVPGFDSKDIHVTVMPSTLTIQAETRHNR